MRQAYDYWQNQPGNYLAPQAEAVGNRALSPAELRYLTAVLGTARQANPRSTLAGPPTRPFAPTEFPTGRSAARQFGAEARPTV